MKLLRKRPRCIRVLAQGREGRLIYDELVDELSAPPTLFEQDFPFAWPKEPVTVQETPARMTGKQLTRRILFGVIDERLDRDELVEFWAQQRDLYRREHSL